MIAFSMGVILTERALRINREFSLLRIIQFRIERDGRDCLNLKWLIF